MNEESDEDFLIMKVGFPNINVLIRPSDDPQKGKCKIEVRKIPNDKVLKSAHSQSIEEAKTIADKLLNKYCAKEWGRTPKISLKRRLKIFFRKIFK